MAHYLGLSTYGVDYYKKTPDTVGIPLDEWQILAAYFEKTAPAKLTPSKAPVPLTNDWAGFSLKKPADTKDIYFTAMVAVDSATQKIYTSDQVTEKFYEWGSDLKPRIVAKLPSVAVDAVFTSDQDGSRQAILSCIGELVPRDFPNGKVVKVPLNSKAVITNPALVQSDLARPVQSISGDFNKDGLMDWVILGQGNKSGGVYLFTQKKDHSFDQANISNKAGAVQGVVGDFNNDGWPDLMVLFGEGDEGLWMFLNDQKEGFTAKNLLHFPPVYGSTSFQLADLNHDGKPDLIYTCGYNYRDSRILKPYHGLYIFTNQGDWNFKQTWFYPINGCTKAIAKDFDGDGDLDIATSAFFADFKGNPAEGFIYFEQDKQMDFKPHAVPVSKYGRWMSIDVADVNHDGKPDIVLGNFSKGMMTEPNVQPVWDMHTPFIILENHLKK
jgi:hypothetical protein